MKNKNVGIKNKENLSAYLTLLFTICYAILFFSANLNSYALSYLIFGFMLISSVGAILMLLSKKNEVEILSPEETKAILVTKARKKDLCEIIYYGNFMVKEIEDLGIKVGDDVGIIAYDRSDNKFHTEISAFVEDYQKNEKLNFNNNENIQAVVERNV